MSKRPFGLDETDPTHDDPRNWRKRWADNPPPQLYIEKPWEDSDFKYGLYPITEEELEAMLPQIVGSVRKEVLIDAIAPILEALGAAFRAEGYVKIDDDAVRRIVEAVDMCFEPSINEREDGAAWLDQIEAAVRHELLGGIEHE